MWTLLPINMRHDSQSKPVATPLQRVIQRSRTLVSWTGLAVAWAAVMLGGVAPWLGGEAPGLPGRFGFVAETLVVLWTPLGLAALLFATLCVVARARRVALLFLPVVAVTLGPEAWAMVRGTPAPPLQQPGTLRVAAVNLAGHLRTDEQLPAVLRELDADVLVLSEFTSKRQRELAEWLVGDYPHRALGAAEPREGVATDGLQLGIWSRLPIVGALEVRLLTSSIAQARAPIRFEGRTVAVFGLHLRQPYPFRNYRGTYYERIDVLDWIREEALPRIVAGDFNAPRRSAFVARLQDLGLTHTATSALGYAPATWPNGTMRRRYFGITLDHILCSDALEIVDFGMGRATPSDHRAVLAVLRWREPD